MAELKKCPFCGGNDIGVKETLEDINFHTGNTIKIWTYCRNCGVTSGTRTIHDCSEDIKIELAHQKWNNRATEAEIRANAISDFLQFVYDNASNEEYANEDGWAFSDLMDLEFKFAEQLKEE